MENENMPIKLREAIVAGIFYPESPEELRAYLQTALDVAKPPREDAQAIVSPHGGFGYSGLLSALAWKSSSARAIRHVIMLAPIHRPESNDAYLPEADVFATPLGPISVDRALREELESCATIFRTGDIPHFEEHGIEVQLPFMKMLFPEATLVPILLGIPSLAQSLAISRALDIVMLDQGASTLLVVSSNLAQSRDPQQAARKTDEVLASGARGDWKAMIAEHALDECSPCGTGCMATLLATHFISPCEFALLGRADSSAYIARANPDATGLESLDDQIVHYAAAAWYPTRS